MTEGDHVPEVAKLKSLFQELCEEEIKTFSRTHGKIDIILDISSRSVFAPGWVLTGRAPARGRREFSVLVEAHSMAIEGSTTRPKENSAKKEARTESLWDTQSKDKLIKGQDSKGRSKAAKKVRRRNKERARLRKKDRMQNKREGHRLICDNGELAEYSLAYSKEGNKDTRCYLTCCHNTLSTIPFLALCIITTSAVA